jgi:hypothetical protein
VTARRGQHRLPVVEAANALAIEALGSGKGIDLVFMTW